MKKYIKAYKVSGIVFVAGIPTVFGSFIGFGMAIGTTAHLVAHLIRSQKIRIVYYALTLVSSLLFAVICMVIFAREDSYSLETAFGILPLLLFAVVIFLGIASAFAARLFFRQQQRAYEKRVETGKSGVNFYE